MTSCGYFLIVKNRFLGAANWCGLYEADRNSYNGIVSIATLNKTKL
ncbi:hypothetical protein [Microcoleus sp.]